LKIQPELDHSYISNINWSFALARLSSYLYPFAGAFFIPLSIGLYEPNLLHFSQYFIYLIIFLLPLFILVRIFYDWSINERTFTGSIFHYLVPIPPALIFSTDLKRNSFPSVTAIIIIINGIIYAFASKEIVNLFAFPPYGNPSYIDILISIFVSAFLHADFSHFAGNMIFFWVFGSTLEPRVGWLRYLLLYFLCIIASNIIVISLLIFQYVQLDSIYAINNFHSIGASGAIAGIMGIFVVRCFFARISVSFPFFFFPFLSLSFKFQGILLISLFFAIDISGSVEQFGNNFIRINYWSHVGGYLGGFMLGYIMKLHLAASKEAVHAKAERYSKEPAKKASALKIYKDILKKEPENEAALKYFFNLCRFNQERAGLYYVRLIQVLIKKDFQKAVELVRENFPNFISALPGQALFRLGTHFYQNYDFNKARFCLELASTKEGPWQAKATFSLGLTFEKVGSIDRAKMQFKEVAKRFPDSPFFKLAKEKLA